MPEGPEVRKISDDLQSLIAGYTLTSYISDPRLKASSLSLLACPVVIKSVSSHGKKVLFHLSKGVLVASLGMTGRYTLEQDSHTMLTLNLSPPSSHPSSQSLASQQTASQQTKLYYDDPRMFGGIAYYDLPFELIKGNFGRDLMKDPPSESEWLRDMRTYKRKNICAVLLDNGIYNSVGNYIKSDSLYLAGISPHRAIDTISNGELLVLRSAVFKVLEDSYKAGGLTIHDFWSVHGERGLYQPVVYNQKVDLQGKTVVYCKVGGRGTYWVPEVQR